MTEIFTSWFGQATLALIIIVLGINTVRNIIAYSGWIKRSDNSTISRLVYGEPDIVTIRTTINEALRAVGISRDRHEKIQRFNEYQVIEPIIIDPDQYHSSLITLLARHTYKSDEKIIYGSKKVTSNFYINTMDASLNKNECEVMTSLLHNLIALNVHRHRKPDFILTPKMGNTAVSLALSEKENAVCVIRKTVMDHSRVSLRDRRKKTKSFINFEGANMVLQIGKQVSRPLYGIAVDCNCSTGESILSTIDEFNKLIEAKLEINIYPVTHAYVLFRADTESNIDDHFEERGMTLTRYVDFDEKSKLELYELAQNLAKVKGNTFAKPFRRSLTSTITNYRTRGIIRV